MTQKEFLEKLREALENELSGYLVQDNINYYSNYITEEVGNGRREEEVVSELGDPWAIAKTIIDSAETKNNTQESNTYETKQRQASNQQSSQGGTPVLGFDTWWKKLLLILGIIGVFAIIIAIIGGIFSLVAPLVVPIIVIVIVFRLIGRMKR